MHFVLYIFIYADLSIYLYNMHECANVHVCVLRTSLSLSFALKHAFSLSLYRSRVHPFIFRMHSLISYALLPQYACWFDCSMLEHFAFRFTSPLSWVCAKAISLSLYLPSKHSLTHSYFYSHHSLLAGFLPTHNLSLSLFLLILSWFRILFTLHLDFICVYSIIFVLHISNRDKDSMEWRYVLYITIFFSYLYFLLLFFLDSRKNTEGNKILYAIFKWNFFHSTFCLFLHIFSHFEWNKKATTATAHEWIIFIHTKFNRLDACLFCYALFRFRIPISPPSSIYEKLAGPLGRAVKRFIIFMLIPNVFNVYEMYTRVRTRFPFFALPLDCCCCCRRRRCCCIEYKLSGWKISIYQSKNVACKIPFGKISCHFQINDAQIYSHLSHTLSHAHIRKARWNSSFVKRFRCGGRKSSSLCNFRVSYFNFSTRRHSRHWVDAHGWVDVCEYNGKSIFVDV